MARIPYTIDKMTKNNGKRAKASNKQQPKRNRQPKERRVSAPIATSTTITPSQFSMTSVSNGVVRLRGHEFLGTIGIFTTGSFIAGIFDLNPACWVGSRLSRIASTYEKYRYDMIRVRYHPATATSSNGSVSMYLEFESNESAATNHVQSLNHQHAALGPKWAPLTITYHRPKEDPTVYYLTNNGAGSSREDLSQAKACFVSGDDVVSVFGYVSIEYDVTFMYPELETGYAGEQYEWSQANYPGALAGDLVTTAPAWVSTNVKVAEIVLEQNLPTVFALLSGNPYNYVVGSVLYTAWDGANWLLFNTLDGAAALGAPLKWLNNVVAGAIKYRVRRLLRT